MSKQDKKLILIILDGWGIGPPWSGNAIFLAQTPGYDNLIKNFPNTKLSASGEAVGLPAYERGNSEAGHLNLGAGKVVHQDVQHIFNLIKDGSFFENDVLCKIFEHVKKNKSNLHLLGLISDGGLHSHIDQLFALLDFCKKSGISDLYLHLFTDGRDTEPQAALSLLSKLTQKIKEINLGKIASISGRYYAMDRDKHWDRIEKAYNAIVKGEGPKFENAQKAVSQSYKQGLTDEFMVPGIIAKTKSIQIQDNDGIIFFNVRGDRAVQLTKAIANSSFKEFKHYKIKNLCFATFVWYGEYIKGTEIAFPPEEVKSPLSKILSDQNFHQFHIAETEKYAHVTYFFNGGIKKPFNKEDRLMIPSPKIPTYDLRPEMSSQEITKEVIKRIQSQKYKFILVNFANPDMVGHTGNLKAAISAVSFIDKELSKIVEACQKKEYACIVTADHGNAEEMVNPKTGEIDTEHTRNPVPFIVADPNYSKMKLRDLGILADVSPTILEILEVSPSSEMTGKSLFEKEG